MFSIGRVLRARRGTRALVTLVVVALAGMVWASLSASVVSAQSTDTTTAADSGAEAAANPQGICLTCGGNTPPVVAVTPSDGTVGSAAQSLTIDWCDDSSLAPTTGSVTPTVCNTAGLVILPATPPAGASSADAGTFHVTVPIT